MTMWERTEKVLIAPSLDDLLNDGRLTRLFSKDARHCALQLWILQIKSEQSIENRVLYGRLLPYSYSSNSWYSSDDDNFDTFGQVQAQVVRLNLYVESLHCTELLRQISAGRTISAISEELRLGLSDQLKARFGATALAPDKVAYRPVAYLLNRDAHDRHSPSSPHGGVGALSASITQTDKMALFRLGGAYDVALTKSVVKHLNADTGLDFGGADTARFGELELMVFPALDDLERPLLNVRWTDAPLALVARFSSMQVPHFGGFQFRLSIANDGQIAYSSIARAEGDADGVFECKFELSEKLRARTDSTELEIFGFDDDYSSQGTLCCRWRIGYIREIHVRAHVVGHSASPIKFDWLEKATRSSMSKRVKAALTFNRGDQGLTNRIGGRDADPWVPANRDLATLFARLYPPKSEGRFFQRWSQGDGEGRLLFVEWFKELLAKYAENQIFIFDPYFEDVGLNLMLLNSGTAADCIVFRSLPKPSKANDSTCELDKPTPSGIDNLLANCEQNRSLLKRIKLRIYGLRDGRLHDRYILFMGSDGLPVAGFNLSNSFQRAAENYPLLVTPIPADVLLKVEQYKSGLIREADAALLEGETENPSLRLLFDSTASPAAQRQFQPLRYLANVRAGDVLSAWTGNSSLRGLSGDPLKDRMTALGLLEGHTLVLPERADLRNCLNQQEGHYEDFSSTWDVIGDALAHTHTEEHSFRDLGSSRSLLEFLARFIETSFNRAPADIGAELAVISPKFLRGSIEDLLYSSCRVDYFFHPTKYAGLSWSEFFAIRFLWRYASDDLLLIFESKVTNLPAEPQGSDAVRLSLLSQIVSEISLSIQFEISDVQRDRLIRSSNGLLHWLGLSAVERQLERPAGLVGVLKLVADFSYPERVRALGWMVQHAAGNPRTTEIYSGLVEALHETLPRTIPADELRRLVDSMRGHMRQLTWGAPWLFQDLVYPLLRSSRVNSDDACEIWVEELAALLEPESKQQPLLFDASREGQTTAIAAYLFGHSSAARRHATLESMREILKRQRRILKQPLASTSDWTRWNGALVVSMWILAFARWGQYYLRESGVSDQELEELSRLAHELAMVRPMHEWRLTTTGMQQGVLAAFLDQAEEHLA